jgi:hypothetical protein
VSETETKVYTFDRSNAKSYQGEDFGAADVEGGLLSQGYSTGSSLKDTSLDDPNFLVGLLCGQQS